MAVPIGAWTTSLVFDVASHLVSTPDFLAEGSRWLIGIGVLGAFAAATVGLIDLLAIPTRTRAFRIALIHMSLNLAATALYVVGFVVRDGTAGPVPPFALGLSAVTLAVVGAAGYLGGELVFRYGVRVADETTQSTGFDTTAKENA